MDIKFDNITFNDSSTLNNYLLYKYLKAEYISNGATPRQAEQATENLMLKYKDSLFTYHGLAYQLGSRSLEFFCMYYLQNVFIGEDKAPIAPIHKEIWLEIQNMILNKSHDKQEYILSRGTGKSTFVSLGTGIWCSCYKYKSYTVIASAIGDTASSFIRNIKLAISSNKRIQQSFGILFDSKKCIVNSEQIELTNHTMIQSVSAASTLRGKSYGNTRIELLLLDDYQKDDEVATSDQRDKKWKKFNDDVKYAMQKNNSTIIAVGTVQHPECFYSRLKTLPTWKVRHEKGVLVDDIDKLFNTGLWLEFKSILFNVKDEYRLDNAKEFYFKYKDKMQYPLLWQSYWDCLKMALEYYENPTSFKQEVQGDTSHSGEKRFTTIVTESSEKIENHDFIKTMLTIDPASSTGEKNDFTAFIVGSTADTNIKYIRSGEILKLKFDEYISHTLELLRNYTSITHIYIEKNLYMGADVIKLKELISRDNELKYRRFTFINEMQKKNKIDKIDSIVGDVLFGRVILNKENTDAIQQLSDYEGETSLHDDFPDCLAECVTRLDMIEVIQKVKILDRRKLGL